MEMVSFLLVPSLVCVCQSIFRHAYPPALSLCVRVLPSVISLSVSVNVSIHAFFRSRVLLYFWIVGVVLPQQLRDRGNMPLACTTPVGKSPCFLNSLAISPAAASCQAARSRRKSLEAAGRLQQLQMRRVTAWGLIRRYQKRE